MRPNNKRATDSHPYKEYYHYRLVIYLSVGLKPVAPSVSLRNTLWVLVLNDIAFNLIDGARQSVVVSVRNLVGATVIKPTGKAFKLVSKLSHAVRLTTAKRFYVRLRLLAGVTDVAE